MKAKRRRGGREEDGDPTRVGADVGRGAAWIPPFLVGAAGATAAELTAGLLLYSGTGLLRGLTVVLATEMVGLSLGLAASRRLDPGNLPAVRRRWVLLLVAFAAAAAFSAGWSVSGGFAAARPAQMLGLAFLGAIPLFAVGSVLGALSRSERGRGVVVATLAALGAAAGFFVTGQVGVPRLQPTSVFLLGVVGVSAAALVHGWLVDRRVVVRSVSDRRRGEQGARLEERVHGASGASARVLVVAGRAVGGRSGDGEPLLAWERAARAYLTASVRPAARILVVGAGTEFFLPARNGDLEQEIVVVEPREDVRRLRLGAGDAGESAAVLRDDPRRFDVVVVNLALLPRDLVLPGAAWDVLREAASARSSDGALLLGGIPVDDPERVRSFIGRLAREAWSPPDLALYRPTSFGSGSADRVLHEEEWQASGLVVGVAADGSPPDRLAGMERKEEIGGDFPSADRSGRSAELR